MCTIDVLKQQELVEAQVEIPEGDHNSLDIPEGNHKDEDYEAGAINLWCKVDWKGGKTLHEKSWRAASTNGWNVHWKGVYVDWDSPPIHDVYYNNDYENNYGSNKNINDRDDVKNDALVEKLVVECKENRRVVQKQ